MKLTILILLALMVGCGEEPQETFKQPKQYHTAIDSLMDISSCGNKIGSVSRSCGEVVVCLDTCDIDSIVILLKTATDSSCPYDRMFLMNIYYNLLPPEPRIFCDENNSNEPESYHLRHIRIDDSIKAIVPNKLDSILKLLTPEPEKEVKW